MAIPDFQSTMLPLLKMAADGKEHTLRRAIETLAVEFRLSEEERQALLASGRQAVFDNRVAWSRTYLTRAGLLESTGRGTFRITDKGASVARKNLDRIDVKFLSQYPEFAAFHSGKPIKGQSETQTAAAVVETQTPEEVLDEISRQLNKALAQELLERVKGCEPEFFEKLVLKLLVAMGYGDEKTAQHTRLAGDGGIDGIINQDKLGLDAVYVQAKRWDANVGRPVVQAFAGSLEGNQASKGVLITTSSFSKDAKDYVNRIGKRIVLMDGEQLAQHMIEHGIGVTEKATYVVRGVDLNYFVET